MFIKLETYIDMQSIMTFQLMTNGHIRRWFTIKPKGVVGYTV